MLKLPIASTCCGNWSLSHFYWLAVFDYDCFSLRPNTIFFTILIGTLSSGPIKRIEERKEQEAEARREEQARQENRKECVAHWTKLFATDEVVYTEPIIQNFLSFINHMSCSADTYVSLGGSNGCADQLTNWDGTQKLELGAPPKKKSQGLSW